MSHACCTASRTASKNRPSFSHVRILCSSCAFTKASSVYVEPFLILCSFICESSTQSLRTWSSDGWKVELRMNRWLESTVPAAIILSFLMTPLHDEYAFQLWYCLKKGIAITSLKRVASTSHCSSGVNSVTSCLPLRMQWVTPASEMV